MAVFPSGYRTDARVWFSTSLDELFPSSISGHLVYRLANGQYGAYPVGEPAPPAATLVGVVDQQGRVSSERLNRVAGPGRTYDPETGTFSGGTPGVPPRAMSSPLGGIGGVGGGLNAPGPGAVLSPVVTGGGNPITPSTGTPSSEAAWEKYQREYLLKAFGVPSWSANPYESWLRSQFPFLQKSYAAAGGQPSTDVTQNRFTDFINQFQGAQDWRGQEEKGLQSFLGAAARPTEERDTWLTGLGGMEGLETLLRGALRTRYASPMADVLASRASDYEADWRAQTGLGTTGNTNFLDWLRQKYGL